MRIDGHIYQILPNLIEHWSLQQTFLVSQHPQVELTKPVTIAATNPSMAARPIQMSKLLEALPCSHRMPTL